MKQTNKEFAIGLRNEIENASVNRNRFYTAFRDRVLTEGQMKKFIGQYFWFCKTFIRTLAGLVANTPDEQEDVRLELVKTLSSELGYGNKQAIHLNQLRKFTKKLGLSEDYLGQVELIPEVKNYIKDLRYLFGDADFRESIGAEFGVEVTAYPEFTYLYPGLKKYKEFADDDINFFKLHLVEEKLHGDWMTEAITNLGTTEQDRELIRSGALKAIASWGKFWDGMYEYVFEENGD